MRRPGREGQSGTVGWWRCCCQCTGCVADVKRYSGDTTPHHRSPTMTDHCPAQVVELPGPRFMGSDCGLPWSQPSMASGGSKRVRMGWFHLQQETRWTGSRIGCRPRMMQMEKVKSEFQQFPALGLMDGTNYSTIPWSSPISPGGRTGQPSVSPQQPPPHHRNPPHRRLNEKSSSLCTSQKPKIRVKR